MIRVGIVGCGRIADQHAAQIGRIEGCRLVGVCDREMLMARQLGDRFGVAECFTDLDALLESARPDVLHITTPPQTHYDLARRCLEAGRHVYVEKPFTLHVGEAEDLLRIAEEKGLKITAGHNHQFDPEMIRMRRLVKQGYLGGPPVHINSMYCYRFGGDVYARAILADRNHWVRRLPGALLQNVISHGIARITEFTESDHPRVIAYGFTSPFLRSQGETEIIDELRVIIHDDDRATAYFTFASQIGPRLNRSQFFGPKNSLVVDHIQRTVIRIKSTGCKSYLTHFFPPFDFATQYLGNCLGNVGRFLRRDFHFDYGMKTLIESFYRSISHDDPVPISYREILVTARIMDDIFTQVHRAAEKAVRAVV